MFLPFLAAMMAGYGLEQRDQRKRRSSASELQNALAGATGDIIDSSNPDTRTVYGPSDPNSTGYSKTVFGLSPQQRIGHAINRSDPMAAMQFMAQQQPQQADPWGNFKEVDGALVEMVNGRPVVAVPKATPQTKPEVTEAQKLVGEIAELKRLEDQYGPDTVTGRAIRSKLSELGRDRPADYGRVDYWRTQVKPIMTVLDGAITQYRKVDTSLSLGTGIGDIAAINAVQKQIDEGAVVRDQDVALIQSAQSFIGSLLTAEGKLRTGELLTPELREQVRLVSEQLTDAIRSGAEERIMSYADVMNEEGVSMDRVVPARMREYYGFGGQGSQQPTSQNSAVVRFKRDASGALVPEL